MFNGSTQRHRQTRERSPVEEGGGDRSALRISTVGHGIWDYKGRVDPESTSRADNGGAAAKHLRSTVRSVEICMLEKYN